MNVFVTGATGFVGKALVLRLLGSGHRVAAFVRSPNKARATLGPDVELVRDAEGLREAAAAAGGIVNLAGEPVLPRRWTASRKRAIVGSRVATTRALVEALRLAPRRPRVLVSASAVGYYGDRGDETLTEASSPGGDFLAHVCRDWEAAAREAEAAGARVVTPRIGVVLGPEGGVLATMLPLFRIGLGGPLGGGRQHVSWIHLQDLVEILVGAVSDERFSGAINAVAPNPVTSRELARAVGRAISRPAVVPAPAWGLRVAVGEAAQALLSSQRAAPVKLRELGFDFRFPALDAALADVLRARVPPIVPARELPKTRYLARRPARFLLTQTTEIDAPIEEVFSFFSVAENLGLLTPPALGLRVRPPAPGPLDVGAAIDYELRIGPVPLRWRTRIERWEPGEGFVDCQEQGPYSSWWHEHRFRQERGRTVMDDHVWFTPPLAFLSERALVAPMLRRIFAYRAFAVRLRFAERQRPAAWPVAKSPSPPEAPPPPAP